MNHIQIKRSMDLFQAAQDTGRNTVRLTLTIAVCVAILIISIGILLLVAPDSVTDTKEKTDEASNISGALTNRLSSTAFGAVLVAVGALGLTVSAWGSISALQKPSVLQMIGLRGIHVHVSSK